MKSYKKQEQGFTLVELLLAMAFFGSVLVVATLLLTQTLNIYNKGMTVKQMNQVGRTLVEELSRVSNSGRSVQVFSSERGTCLNISGTPYIWNNATAEPSDTDGYVDAYYRFDSDTGSPVNFVRYSEGECPSGNNFVIARSATSPVVGDNVRVYDSTITQINPKLVRVQLTLGTYDSFGSDYNPQREADDRLVCRVGGIGNFCATVTFDTVLYVPNGELN